MGLFTSKIAIGVLTGGFSLGSASLLFTGTETLHNATTYVKEAGTNLIEFKGNEQTLLAKIGLVKENANDKIESANTIIADQKAEIINLKSQVSQLTADKENLINEVAQLKSDISELKTKLVKSNKDLEATKAALAVKTKEYELKSAQLKVAGATILGLQKSLEHALAKAKEVDAHVAELESQLQQANKEIAEHGKVVELVKEETKDATPLSADEIEAIDTELTEVDLSN